MSNNNRKEEGMVLTVSQSKVIAPMRLEVLFYMKSRVDVIVFLSMCALKLMSHYCLILY